jgi:serine/threonine protein phosphatase 1
LHWGHAEFEKRTRQDGFFVLHGHTIVDTGTVTKGRIAIDTGAYATGRLTAARVSEDGVTFQTI